MYRYSRGQSGQGSLPRAAWGGSGAHGARAASPEPGGGADSEPTKERQDEAISQLENELIELRNQLAWKDQRIAALSRADTPATRLKRDIRQLASELHHARKQLSESVAEVQDLTEQLQRLDGNVGNTGSPQVAPGDCGSSSCSVVPQDREPLLRELSAAHEENRQLRDTVMQLNAQASRQSSTAIAVGVEVANSSAVRPHVSPSGASSRVSEAPFASAPQPEEPIRQMVYSSLNPEFAATIGVTMLQGVGTVDGVTSVARVLLQHVRSSVCSVHRHQQQLAGVAQ